MEVVSLKIVPYVIKQRCPGAITLSGDHCVLPHPNALGHPKIPSNFLG